MTVYINMRTNAGVETVDEFDTYKEAREMIREYRLAWAGSMTGPLYLSQRSTREWAGRPCVLSGCTNRVEWGGSGYCDPCLQAGRVS